MDAEAVRAPVQSLALRRRRSRVPWIYLVYHARAAGLSRAGYMSLRRRNAGTSSETGSNSAGMRASARAAGGSGRGEAAAG